MNFEEGSMREIGSVNCVHRRSKWHILLTLTRVSSKKISWNLLNVLGCTFDNGNRRVNVEMIVLM
ncbi:hypothetical protein Hdeb2414_s0001g00017061 [Helianthus debilis subsp. tardiflorus]